MAEKKFFVYKLSLSLNISDFSLFFCKNCNPPVKMSPHLSQEPISKNLDSVKPPRLLLKI